MTPDEALPYQMAALGLLIGSFLNVCILRLPVGQSVARPASGCPRCGHLLAWWENIPVVSFLVLRARCRSCRTSISWQYPIVELITGLLYVGLTLQYGFGWLLYSRVVLVSSMVVLFMISLRHRTLPAPIAQVGIGAGVIFSMFAHPGWSASLLGATLAGSLLVIAFVAARLRRQATPSTGNATLLAMVGAFLGWQGLLVALALTPLVAATLAGARLASPRVSVTFGACLAAATMVAAFADGALLRWAVGHPA